MRFSRAESTAQSAAADGSEDEEMEGFKAVCVADGEAVAKQKGDALLTQKTSRQHAVTPRLGGRLEKEGNLGRLEGVMGGFEDDGGDCDCSRTRTTSRGVTAKQMVSLDSSPYV